MALLPFAAAATKPGGSSGQLQYNNAGVFGGIPGSLYQNGSPEITFTSQSATHIPLRIVGASSQTALLTQWRNNNNDPLINISAAGYLGFQTLTPDHFITIDDEAGVGISNSISVARNTGITYFKEFYTTSSDYGLAIGGTPGVRMTLNQYTGNFGIGLGTIYGTDLESAPSELTMRPYILTSNIGTPIYTGRGLDDMSATGFYTGSFNRTYTVIVTAEASPDLIQVYRDGNSSQGVIAQMQNTPTSYFNDGVYISFASVTGHTAGDQWDFTVTASPALYEGQDGDVHAPNVKIFQNGQVSISDPGVAPLGFLHIEKNFNTPENMYGFYIKLASETTSYTQTQYGGYIELQNVFGGFDYTYGLYIKNSAGDVNNESIGLHVEGGTAAIDATSTTGIGVRASSTNSYGVNAQGDSGVYASGTTYGVQAYGGTYGLYAQNTNGNRAIWGNQVDPSGFAGYFDGARSYFGVGVNINDLSSSDGLNIGDSSNSTAANIFFTGDTGPNVISNSLSNDLELVAGGSLMLGTGANKIILGFYDYQTPQDLVLRGEIGAGTDVAGGDITFKGSTGTGTGGGGDFIWMTAPTATASETITAVANDFATGTGSSLTKAITIAAGTDLALIAHVTQWAATDGLTGITWNGVAMTLLKSIAYASGPVTNVYYMVAPATGTHNLVASFSGNRDATLSYTLWSGVDPVTPFTLQSGGLQYISNSGTSNTPTVTLLNPSGDVVIDTVTVLQSDTITVGTGQTQIQNITSGNTKAGISKKAGVGGSTTMYWSGSINERWTSIAFSLHPNQNNNALTEAWHIDLNGHVYGKKLHNNSVAVTGTTNQYVASGTYTPTLTNVTNVSASTAYSSQWIRVGNVVTVSGKVDIDTTLAAGTASELGMSLPLASALTAEEQVGGTATSDSVASLSARIKADATNDRASFVFKSISLTNDSYAFSFQYLIL